MNGHCGADGSCACGDAWRGPTCASFKLGPTPRNSGFRHENHSSWGGSIVKGATGAAGDSAARWHMFSSFILGGCGLGDWSVNSVIVRAVATNPLGPYTMQEKVAGPFAHEPNLVSGTGVGPGDRGGGLILFGTMNRHPGAGGIRIGSSFLSQTQSMRTQNNVDCFVWQ